MYFASSIENLPISNGAQGKNPFSISVFKCRDEECIECLSYNENQRRGICTKCAQNFVLTDEVCISN